MVARSATETHAQRLARLANQALKRGLRILEYAPARDVFCTSHSHPEHLHRVTMLGCDCPGFFFTGECQHHALLMHDCGLLPPTSGSANIIPFPKRPIGAEAIAA
jgi:hypothetical protein